MEKFENKIIDMRDMYEDRKSHGIPLRVDDSDESESVCVTALHVLLYCQFLWCSVSLISWFCDFCCLCLTFIKAEFLRFMYPRYSAFAIKRIAILLSSGILPIQTVVAALSAAYVLLLSKSIPLMYVFPLHCICNWTNSNFAKLRCTTNTNRGHGSFSSVFTK